MSNNDTVKLVRVPADKLADLEAENAKLREIVSKVATNIGNGAFCDPSCSLEFMESVAEEVRLETTALRQQIAALEAARKVGP